MLGIRFPKERSWRKTDIMTSGSIYQVDHFTYGPGNERSQKPENPKYVLSNLRFLGEVWEKLDFQRNY